MLSRLAFHNKFAIWQFSITKRVLVNSLSSERTLLELEKEMFAVKRQMLSLYKSGKDYDEALACAKRLAEMVANCRELGGPKTSVYASCLNNLGLMVKYH
jgi:hypothetical protein